MKKHPIVKSLSSVLLGIVLLIALAVASIWGSLLSSNPNIGIEGARAQVFNTWWYTTLLGLLVVNLVLCSWDRTMWAIKLWGWTSFQANKRFFLNQQSGKQIPLKSGLKQAVRQLQRHYTTCRVQANAVHAQKGLLGRLGAPVAHLGVILVLVSGLLRMFGDHLGYAVLNAQVTIPEAGAVDYYYVPLDRHQPLSEENRRGVPLGFQVRCLDFDEEKFPHSEVPRSYSSQVEIRDGEKRVLATINMARPLNYKGYKFHQISFFPNQQVERAMVEIVDSRTLNRVALLDISPQTPVAVPKTPYWIEIEHLADESPWELTHEGRVVAQGMLERPGERFSYIVERLVTDFRMGPNQEVFSASDEWKNPAVLIGYHEEDKKVGENWFFYRPEFRRMSATKRGQYDLEFVDYRADAEDVSNTSASLEVKIQVRHKTGAEIGSYWVRVGEKIALDQPHADAEVTSPTLTSSQVAASSGMEAPDSKGDTSFLVRYRGPTTGYSSVLGMVKDPSIPLTYAGCILIVLGPLLAFFTTYRQVWAYYDENENQLYLALSVRGRSEGPVKEYHRIVQRLRDRENS